MSLPEDLIPAQVGIHRRVVIYQRQILGSGFRRGDKRNLAGYFYTWSLLSLP